MIRSTNIDLCRGLLFVLMANTHALSVTGVPHQHWLFSNLWLPNGWATVVFVVLSGFSVGFVCSARLDAIAMERTLMRRSGQIVGVMLLSNTVFAILREFVGGNLARVAELEWWIGFITLDTAWTISGVLLPTALVVTLGLPLYRMTKHSPWIVLPILIVTRVLCTAARLELVASGHATDWSVRFFFTEGLGGFPVLPFVLNGFIGVWIGVLRNHSESQWRVAIIVLLLLQLGVYATSFWPPVIWTTYFVAACGAVGKFAWAYLAAHLLKLWGTLRLINPVELIGTFALGSFVMHRVFLQMLTQVFQRLGMDALRMELRYAALLGGTLLLTWALCAFRLRLVWLDAPFRRLAL